MLTKKHNSLDVLTNYLFIISSGVACGGGQRANASPPYQIFFGGEAKKSFVPAQKTKSKTFI